MIVTDNDIMINVLPFGKANTEGGYEHFVECWHNLCLSKKWIEQKKRIQLSYESNEVNVSGGRFRLEKHSIHIVSEFPSEEERSSSETLTRWLDRYQLIFLICDASELLQSAQIRHDMAFYRMAMRQRGRYLSCYLLLTDVEEVMEIEYTGKYATTMIGICTAFSNKGYNHSHLAGIYQDTWNLVASEYVGQIWAHIKTEIRKQKFYLPINLLCTSRLYRDAGYLEALEASINELFSAKGIILKNSTRNKLYNDMKNNNMLLNLIPGLSQNKNQIRLAVIGQTSSGKTYFLTDLCQAISRMGYKEINDAKSPFRFVGNFLNDVSDPESGIDGTPVYICRQNNHYQTNYHSTDNSDNFSLEFVDIPGEVITRNSIEEFISIVIALNNCDDAYFEEHVWKTEKGKKISVVHFARKEENKSESNNEIDNLPELETNQSLPSLDSTSKKKSGDYFSLQTGRRDKMYLPTKVVEEDLTRKRYIKDNSSKKISGRELLEGFYRFYPDTVVNAISDAWDVLDIQTKFHKGDQEAGILETDGAKIRFDKKYKDQFYFLYYCLTATDIVLCDKLAVPSSDNLTDSPKGNFEQLITALGVFKSLLESLKIKGQKEKKWYLAFKGVDSIMKTKNFKQLHDFTHKDDEDAVYSYFTLALSQYVKELGEINDDELDDDEDDTDTIFIEDTENNSSVASSRLNDYAFFKDLISGNSDSFDAKLEIYHKYWNDYEKFFKSQEKYYMTSKKSLDEHIKSRLNSFRRIVGECQNKEVYTWLQILPHVFFTATPIDEDFKIYGHKDGNSRCFKGDVSSPERRLCFGTYQLLKDILLQNGLKLPRKAENYGTLLSFFFGGK